MRVAVHLSFPSYDRVLETGPAAETASIRYPFEEVDEEIVRQSLRPLGEDAVLRLSDLDIQNTEAANEYGHLRRGQRQQLVLVDQDASAEGRIAALCGSCETRRRWLERPRSSLDIGLRLLGIRSARREPDPRHKKSPAFLAACSTAATPPRTIRSASDTFLPLRRVPSVIEHSFRISPQEFRQNQCQSLSGSLTSQFLCGSRRIPAPRSSTAWLVPIHERSMRTPQAVDTSSADGQARSPRIVTFRSAMSCVFDQDINKPRGKWAPAK